MVSTTASPRACSPSTSSRRSKRSPFQLPHQAQPGSTLRESVQQGPVHPRGPVADHKRRRAVQGFL